MDIEAKHIQADKDGVRIAELTERSYREKMWSHRPLTEFWRVGKGYASKLESVGMYTMGDVARMSVKNEDLLYRMFGINAELLIDHAWGRFLVLWFVFEAELVGGFAKFFPETVAQVITIAKTALA